MTSNSAPSESSFPDDLPDALTDALRHASSASLQDDAETIRTLAYCSANDRNVPVLIRRAGDQRKRRRPSYRDAERLVCLDYGVRCTGFLCPLFDVPTLREDELEERPHRRPS